MNLPKFIGVDIGKNTIKIAQVEVGSGAPKISRLASFPSGKGGLSTEDASLINDLAARLKDGVAQAKLTTNKAVVALPEPVVFNRLLTLPSLDEAALNEAIHWNAKQFIPIPSDEVQMDWIRTGEITVEGKKMVQLLLVAAPKKIINQALTIFNAAGLELIAIETESVATSRLIGVNYPDKPAVMVLDIGAGGTDLSVVAAGSLIFSQSLGTGGEAMTRAIASSFSLDAMQAEQYKIKLGLLPNQADGKIYKVLEPVVNIIVAEVTKTLNFFRTKYQQSTPQSIVLLGEAARTPGLVEFISTKLGLPTEVIAPKAGIQFDSAVDSELQGIGMSGYAVAMGLAMKTK